LSDLLTPRETILNRLEVAAKGDFVTALYNPRSKRRTELLDRALDIFHTHRPPGTPVVVASNLGRPEERVRIVPLADFDASEIDMLTIVLVGSSQSRTLMRGDGKTLAFTPRGYEQKSKKEAAE
jgi:cobalt-precorrin 5A hydrolase/precorrin-3B C17-methyltransferase